MKAVADTLGVSRSNLIERLKGKSKPRGPYYKVEDAELLPAIRRPVNQRPTYGYRRIAALLNRERRAADKPVVNAKRVHRIMGNHAMLLEKHTAVRKGRTHDGKVMVMCSNLRWCSDGLEFTCWNGEAALHARNSGLPTCQSRSPPTSGRTSDWRWSATLKAFERGNLQRTRSPRIVAHTNQGC